MAGDAPGADAPWPDPGREARVRRLFGLPRPEESGADGPACAAPAPDPSPGAPLGAPLDAPLEALIARLAALPPARQAETLAAARGIVGERAWMPSPGPQTEAFFSPADILLYGGQGGGGKTDLILGLAFTAHRRSLVMRRQYTDLGAITERAIEINGTRAGFNGASPPKLRTPDGRLIEFGAARMAGDERSWQGQPHDLLGLDEATQFLELQVRFLMGWVRSAVPEQRTRVVLATNPPLTAEGQWVVGMFRPWLDVTHPNPARPGELRWFVTDPEGKDLEVEGPRPVDLAGKTYIPRSRSFIPAALGDNPFLVRTGYQAQLDALPEPIRSAVRDGNFMAAREDDAMQVVPTAWVLAANARWEEGRPRDVPMTALGLDVARGGRDATVLSPRYGLWFDRQIAVPGRETPDGPSVVALAVRTLRDGAVVGLDAIGVGASVQDHLKSAGVAHEPINGATRAHGMTRDGAFGFLTRRAEMWWQFREALDPDYGIGLALPPDPALLADLTAPLYTLRPGDPPKIQVEAKDDIIKRLGRSPDKGDSAVLAWAAGLLEPARDAGRGYLAPAETSQDYDPLRY